ncbi:MAG: hypothetical protein IJ628_03605, partial [Bacteroidaceae bacterium]|nr:hypothetical protein [Bacteroidaceae bacterium]
KLCRSAADVMQRTFQALRLMGGGGERLAPQLRLLCSSCVAMGLAPLYHPQGIVHNKSRHYCVPIRTVLFVFLVYKKSRPFALFQTPRRGNLHLAQGIALGRLAIGYSALKGQQHLYAP